MTLHQHSETNPRPENRPQPESPARITPTIKVRSNLFQRVDFSEDTLGFHGGSSRRTGTKLALWTWMSAAVDTLIMISMSCFFVIAFSLLMKTSARAVLASVFQDFGMLKLFASAFVTSFWIYLIFLRGFNGATIGEWTCSLRLGQPWQHLQSGYVWKVLLRTTLILATGIVTLPILSLLFKKDLAGEISGVKIYSLV